jgi:hypothetical protein
MKAQGSCTLGCGVQTIPRLGNLSPPPMPTDQWTSIRYLLPPRGSFWRWIDDGAGLGWDKGETIAFREEILVVLRRLADTGAGLPPLAAIVLLLAATRDNWTTAGTRLITHAENLAESGGGDTSSAVGVTLRAVGHRLVDDTRQVFDKLQVIADLSPELRRAPSAKANLADIVFTLETRSTAFDAAAVLGELESNPDPATADSAVLFSNIALRELVDTLDALRSGLAGLDAAQIEMRLKTGLDTSVKPAEIDLGPSDRARRLMNEPDEDSDVSAVARIARGLLAAVAVPRPVGHPDDRPAGGVTDISNRGPLDRLLLSELAQDDLTLAVRIAVNEALYMQRETPPRHPPRLRAIFVDTGIRTWGVPRIYIAAVALALTATADADGDVTAWRAQGDASLSKADLSTRPGLTRHLAALGDRAHFGDSLAEFTALIARAGDTADPFFVTHEDVLEDPDFQKAMRDHGPETTYAAAVGRNGSFRLWHLSAAGRHLVRSAQFDLEKLLEPPKHQPRKKLPPLISPATELPEIFSATPFPLRLPPTSRVVATAVHAEAGVVGITQDRRLLHWDQLPDKGPLQLSAQLPKGSVQFLAITAEKQAVAVIREDDAVGRCLTVVADLNLQTVDIKWIEPQPTGTHYACHAGMLYIIEFLTVTALLLDESKPVAAMRQHPYRWTSGRCFAASDNSGGNGRSHAVLSFDGGALLKLEPVATGSDFVEVVFEPNGGPFRDTLTMKVSGRIHGSDGKQLPIEVKYLHDVRFVDADQRLTGRGVTPDRKSVFYELDFRSANPSWRVCQPVPAPTSVLHWPIHWMPGRLRTRFDAIAVDQLGTIRLRGGRKSEQLGIVFSESQNAVVLQRTDAVVAEERWRPFRPMDPASPDQRWLSVASWPQGSEAFIDHRGMLHLRSSYGFFPEISLVLANNSPMAAWTSNGKLAGPAYYFDGNATIGPANVLGILELFSSLLK